MRTNATLVFIAILLLILPAHAGADESISAENIRQRIEYIQHTGDTRLYDEEVMAGATLVRFYERRSFKPAWENPDHIEAMITTIRAASHHGLTPEHYHLDALDDLRRRAQHASDESNGHDDGMDILLTDSFLLLARDLSSGRVNPADINPAWNFDAPQAKMSLDAMLELSLADGSFQDRLESLAPAHPLYRRMTSALQQYRALALAGGWDPIPEGPLMEVGVTDERVPLLRERLTMTGDLSIATEGHPLVFEAPLARAVLRFQERNRVSRESWLVDDSDGVVGEETLAALNVPVEERIQQLRTNLERCRLLLRDLPSTFVLVDMAGYRGYYYQNDDIIWRARVQIGDRFSETPSFRSDIKYIVFNPTWTVPPGILRDVVLPQIRKDPAYLAEDQLEVIDRNGRRIDPATVAWSRYNASNLPYRIVQTPGPHNALGRVKFIFPNPHYIYLHDTPHQTEFGLDERAFSAGCIRIDKPYKLAKRLLDDPGKWTIGRILNIIDGGKTQTVFLPKPVPVLMIYFTARVDDQRQVHFRKDVYKRDAAFLKLLDAPSKPLP